MTPATARTWRDMTPDEKARAVRPLADEGLTAAQIAGKLGATSRNAVVGVADRNGIRLTWKPLGRRRKARKARKAPEQERETQRQADEIIAARLHVTREDVEQARDKQRYRELRIAHHKARRQRARKKAAERAEAPREAGTVWIIEAPGPAAVPIMEAGPRQCRWPVGDWDNQHVNEKHVCGAATLPDLSWCEEHFAIVAGDGTATERAAEKIALRAHKLSR